MYLARQLPVQVRDEALRGNPPVRMVFVSDTYSDYHASETSCALEQQLRTL